MTEYLWPGLILAIAAGLGVLATRFPEEFQKLLPVLSLIVTALFVGAMGWSLGHEFAFTALNEFIESGKYPEARKAIGEQTISPPIVMLCYLLVLGYVGLLDWLSKQIIVRQKPPPSSKRKAG